MAVALATADDAIILALLAQFGPRLLVHILLLLREGTLLAQVLVSNRYILDFVVQTGSRTLLLGIDVGHGTHDLSDVDVLSLNGLSREAADVEACVVLHLL